MALNGPPDRADNSLVGREQGDGRGGIPAQEPDHTVVRAQLEVRDRLRDTSSLPVAMFDACDPMMEAVLTQAATTLFLDHMRLARHPDLGDRGSQWVEDVDPTEIQALCTRLAAEEDHDPPSLRSDLTRERLWVLLDLVVAGSPAARATAAARLHETLGEILDPAQLDPMLLEQVTALLAEACLHDQMPELLRDLLRGADGGGS